MYTEEQIKLLVEVGSKILKESYMPELTELIVVEEWEAVVTHLNEMANYVCGMVNAEEFLREPDPTKFDVLREYMEMPEEPVE